MRLSRELESAGKRQGWWDSGGLLAALSGGGDSMAMLALLRMSYGGRIVAAHLEHGFRGEASLSDAKFVENFCQASGVPCYVRHADVAGLRLKGESSETAGRRVRYEFFGEILERENLSFIATAHNAGDVAETAAHHFFRGTGIAGLSGISERRGRVVRPILNCAREDLRQFLREEGVPWREDETNSENVYTRNKIRNGLLPWARSNLNESADRSILGLAGECSRVSKNLRAEAENILRLVGRDHPFALAAWDAGAACRLSDTQLSSALRAQAEALGLPVLDRHRMELACGMIRGEGRGRFQWAGDVEVCCGHSLLGWIRRGVFDPPDSAEIALTDGGLREAAWGPWTVKLEMKRYDSSRAGIGNSGRSKTAFMSRDASGIVEICDANSFMKKNNLAFHVKIPWWSIHNTPALSWKSENSFESWLPGARREVRGEGAYVIIAHVFVRER
jgi:tRNA(Ile)-lysidine synthase